jgi:hypothetical protein
MACITRRNPPQEFIAIQNKEWSKNWYGYRDVFLEYLLLETEGYCPFSFAFIVTKKFEEELRDRDDEEIEHFRPKDGKCREMLHNGKKFSELYFDWNNLFPIISTINKCKGSRWDVLLLKPDEDDYLEFMIYNPATGMVYPKYGISENNLNRAIATINLYNLNGSKLCSMRKRQYLKYIENPSDPHPFRPIFDNI